MSRGQAVILGDKTFKTKQEGLVYFKTMLAKYAPEEVVGDDDAIDLHALLKRHPEFAEKSGHGIDHFEVMAADYGTKCFCVIRRNGTRIDFSYVTCVNAEPGSE
jgi:hypothetical protein